MPLRQPLPRCSKCAKLYRGRDDGWGMTHPAGMTHWLLLGRQPAWYTALLLLLYRLLLVRHVALWRHGTVLPTMRLAAWRLVAGVLGECCVWYCGGGLHFQECPHLTLPALGTPRLALTRFLPLLLLLLLLSKLPPRRLLSLVLGLVLGQLCRVLCRHVLLRGRRLGWGGMHWHALRTLGCLHCRGLWGLAINCHGLPQLLSVSSLAGI